MRTCTRLGNFRKLLQDWKDYAYKCSVQNFYYSIYLKLNITLPFDIDTVITSLPI
jgi:hypothetical protein